MAAPSGSVAEREAGVSAVVAGVDAEGEESADVVGDVFLLFFMISNPGRSGKMI
jgi:hypothetical protein